MTKKISVAACVLILISFPILVVCPDATAAVYSSISGKVIAEDTGAGLANVPVLAFLVGGGHGDYYYAPTDARGVYVLKDLNPGTYLIGFYKENDFYVKEEPHVEVVLPKGKHVVNVNHVLMLGGSISGTVYQSDGTTPMAEVGVYASVSGIQQNWIDSSRYRATGIDGKFLLQGLPPSDNCTIAITVPGHARMTKTVKITKGTVTGNVNFTVKWDDVTGINGYIKSSVDGKPIKDAEVDLRDGSGSDIGYTRTDDTGKYSIVGVTPGTYHAVAYWPEGGSWIGKENILVGSGKSTVVNFEFDKPAPTSKNAETRWKILYGLLIPDAFAQGGGGNDPFLNFEGCGEGERNIVRAVYASVKTFIKRYTPPKNSLCLSRGDLGLQKKLKEKIKTPLTIICKPKEECTAVGTMPNLGGSEITLCPEFFDLYRSDRDRNKKCPESAFLHELVHLVQDIAMARVPSEQEAYACGEYCYPTCTLDDPESTYKGGCCR